MKKAISLLIALAVILSLGSIAFAAEDNPGNYGVQTAPRTILSAARVAAGTSGTTVSVGAGELFLVYNNKDIVGTETELRPDENYKFDIYYTKIALSGTDAAVIASAAKLVQTDIGKGNVKVRTLKGSSAIQSAKIKTVGSGTARTYRLEIDTRANYGTKITDVEYALNVNDSDTLNPFTESIHTFTVGFNTISDSDTDVGEDGVLTISNDAPVITKDQFTDIAKSANYKNVTIESEDGNWSFKGKVAGMKDSNFSYNYDPDTDLLNKFPELEFKFLNFPAGVNFPTTGEMRIDVSDISEDFSTMYAYLYRDGKLTAINGTYDSGADELIFRTNYLGRFIITNEPITDTSLIPEEEPEEEPDLDFEEDEEDIPEAPQVPNQTTNPPTGAAPTNVLVTFGLLTLASGAMIGRKRK